MVRQRRTRQILCPAKMPMDLVTPSRNRGLHDLNSHLQGWTALVGAPKPTTKPKAVRSMSILVDGIPRSHASMTARPGRSIRSRRSPMGRNMVAGVTPGKGGRRISAAGFNTVEEAFEATGATRRWSMSRRPMPRIDPRGDRRRGPLIVTTPRHSGPDMVRSSAFVGLQSRLIGPNCRACHAGGCKIGIMPQHLQEGSVGIARARALDL